MRIFYAARLIPLKDPASIVYAAHYFPNDKFVVAGDGSELERLKSEAGVNVKFLGWVSQKRIIEEMEKADVFCQLCKVENIWSSSLVCALKHGKAIICSDAGLSRRFLESGIHVLFVPVGNHVRLADALEKLHNKKLRGFLGENAKRFYLENLDVDVSARYIKGLMEVAVRAEQK